MPHIRINVDGAPGDTADLYEELKSARLPRSVELIPASSRDGSLGLFDSILAVVNTIAALGGLVFAILQWRKSTGAAVRFVLDDDGSPRTIEVENADNETVELVWKMIEQSEDQ